MDFFLAHKYYEVFEYDGTNGQDIVDQLNMYSAPGSYEVVTEGNGHLTYRFIPFDEAVTIDEGNLMVVTGKQAGQVEFHTPTEFAKRYMTPGQIVDEGTPPAPE